MKIKNTVKVEVLSFVDGKELEKMIQDYFDEGFVIQDSQVEWYQGQIMGVYVFVKESN